jgi:hypothetical protein
MLLITTPGTGTSCCVQPDRPSCVVPDGPCGVVQTCQCFVQDPCAPGLCTDGMLLGGNLICMSG